jgi:superfamily II DNA/RNA helicase
MNSFSLLELLPSIQATLAEKGLVRLTEIQAKTLPLLLEKQSVVGVSETGSGKTLSYVLPVLHHLKVLENSGDPVKVDALPRAAVIVPTRELGEQVSRVFKPFTHTTRLRVRTVLGGTTFEQSRRSIAGPFEVLVATPGRLVQLMDKQLISLSDVRLLVIDEADQMLDQGFMDDIRQITKDCPADRQMALFSATVSQSVQKVMTDLFSDAEVVRSNGSSKVVATLKTINRNVVDGDRIPLLVAALSEPVQGGTVLFVNTREQCDALALEVGKLGRTCVVYRGEMDKLERRANLKSFRDGKVDLLISTDLASRGLDVEHVGRVINYHLPQQMENYLHRAGRTARAGREGVVINFVTKRDQALMDQLEGKPAAPKRPTQGRSFAKRSEHRRDDHRHGDQRRDNQRSSREPSRGPARGPGRAPSQAMTTEKTFKPRSRPSWK